MSPIHTIEPVCKDKIDQQEKVNVDTSAQLQKLADGTKGNSWNAPNSSILNFSFNGLYFHP